MKRNASYYSRLLAILVFTIHSDHATGQDFIGRFYSDSSCIRVLKTQIDGVNLYFIGHSIDTITNTRTDVIFGKVSQSENSSWYRKYNFGEDLAFSRWGIKKAQDGCFYLLMDVFFAKVGIIKVDSTGNFIWGRWFAKPYNDVHEIERNKRGDILVSGNNSNANSLNNGFFFSLDADGNFLK